MIAIEALRREIGEQRDREISLIDRQARAAGEIQETASRLADVRQRIAELEAAIKTLSGATLLATAHVA